MSELPSARVVFDVSIEGSARKVITVRSALLIHNQLDEKVQVKLENTLPYADGKWWENLASELLTPKRNTMCKARKHLLIIYKY